MHASVRRTYACNAQHPKPAWHVRDLSHADLTGHYVQCARTICVCVMCVCVYNCDVMQGLSSKALHLCLMRGAGAQRSFQIMKDFQV